MDDLTEESMTTPINNPRQIEVVDDVMVQVLRTKSPAEKIAMVCDAHQTARLILQAQISERTPHWTLEETQAEVARRMLGGNTG